MSDNLFIREFELCKQNKSIDLTIAQNEVGDVGAVVWDSALVTCKFFERMALRDPDVFRNKNIVELGAGTGICSVVLSCLGAHTYCTDLPEQLPLLNRNKSLNDVYFSGSMRVAEHRWGDNIPSEFRNVTFDWIVMVDCLYYEESLEPLMKTILALTSSRNTKILCVYEKRDIGKPKIVIEQFFELPRTRAIVTFELTGLRTVANDVVHVDLCLT